MHRHLLTRLFAIAAASVLVGGCASPPSGRYWSEYEVSGRRVTSQEQAEAVHRDQVNAGAFLAASESFDKPLKLLRAPQPAMPHADTYDRVVGEVTVRLRFNCHGAVEQVDVLHASKESLAAAAVQAVKQWQIEPATRKGKPVEVVVQQTFGFRGVW